MKKCRQIPPEGLARPCGGAVWKENGKGIPSQQMESPSRIDQWVKMYLQNKAGICLF